MLQTKGEKRTKKRQRKNQRTKAIKKEDNDQGKARQHTEIEEGRMRQCRFWKVGRVPVSEGGGVGRRETAEVGWLIDCSDLRAPSLLYVSLLMDFTFFVSLTHKSELSAVLNKNICGIASSDKSQWFTPLAKTSLPKPAVYWHWAGLGRVIPKITTCCMSPERYACLIITAIKLQVL